MRSREQTRSSGNCRTVASRVERREPERDDPTGLARLDNQIRAYGDHLQRIENRHVPAANAETRL